MGKIIEYIVDKDAVSELYNIGNGIFYPLKGFMDSADYKSVVEDMHLNSGLPWTIPITLDVPEDMVDSFIGADMAILKDSLGSPIAELAIEDVYKVDFDNDIKKVFGTVDKNHPGVAKELSRSSYRVGGPIRLLRDNNNTHLFVKYSLTPEETKIEFRKRGWQTIAGFQTRNPIHRAHEYLQRVAMEITDGIFIQPLVGWKKKHDFTSLAIIKCYEKMLEEFYPKNRVMLGVLATPMRYAGPREAIFHAIIRKNYGCTHFIIGRDHAGVGNYYKKYEAHKLCSKFDNLGIEILRLCGPYYCNKCRRVVTEKTCPHGEDDALHISGTYIRSQFFEGRRPAEEYMRKEIIDILVRLKKDDKLFCKGVDNEF